MELHEILSRFEAVTEHEDGGYSALCPAHADSKPSLRLWRGENLTMRTHCRVGCTFADIVSSAGLRQPDMFNVGGEGNTVPAERPKLVTGSPVTRLAVYIDRTREQYAGSPAEEYAARRFGVTPELAERLELGYDPGHGFVHTHQAYDAYPRLVVPFVSMSGHPHALQGRDVTGDCPGRWVGPTNPNGQRWGQYGVFRGGADSAPVIVSEGPGDGLTAAAQGYDAVCIRGAALAGTQELLTELAQGLTGRHVLAAGDSDTAGRAFNRKLADGLRPHGIDVYELPIPPELGDLTDWREQRPDRFAEELSTAVDSAQRIEEETTSTEVAAAMAGDDGALTRDDGLEAARVMGDMLTKLGAGDAVNAYALVEWTGGRIRYAKGLGFYVWNGRVWENGETRVRQEIHRMGAALMLAGRVDIAKSFTTRRCIDDMITELKAVRSVYVDSDAFDANPDILSFRNGVVDLRTGRLREHRMEDLVTASVDIDYDADAKCPGWHRFLGNIMPGMADMPDYLQRLVGYAITGHVGEQCFVVLWGKGANGKSVFTDALAKVFKAVHQNTPFATFEEKASGGIPNDLAALRDARLVTSSEGESGKPMSEAILKRASGGDEMTARFMRQEFFTFTPKFLIMMASNHKPSFRGADEGLWRRVKLVPFKRYFAPEEREDKAVMDRRFQVEEAQGLVAWAVRGAVEWYKRGLDDPTEIKEAVKDYRETSDALSGFAPGVYEITKDEDDKVVGSDAFNDYLDWCEAENLPQKERWRRTTFYRACEERGVVRRKTAAGITLFGIRKTVVADAHPDTPDLFKE